MFTHDDILMPLALTVMIDHKIKDPELREFRLQAAALFNLFEIEPLTEEGLVEWFSAKEAELKTVLTGRRKNTEILRALTRFSDDQHVDCLLYTSPSPRDS